MGEPGRATAGREGAQKEGRGGRRSVTRASSTAALFTRRGAAAPPRRREEGEWSGGRCMYQKLRREVMEEHLAISHGQSRVDPSRVPTSQVERSSNASAPNEPLAI